MPTVYIDNVPYAFDGDGKNLLEVCLSLGCNLPFFCWHPALHSVGACRQCAVKLFTDAQDTRGRIVMACMTPAHEGMRISVDDPEAVAFRAGVIEWLMVNHPHDCPVCDEGGECHLQDMTVMTGHIYRRARVDKRTYPNQNLGPLINHEMNRCIQCYRCVRFYVDYAGGRDFGVQGWHNHVYFGRATDGVLESEFSGNLVEVCPTGVFTDKTHQGHFTRKWDLQTAPSICVHCGLGCNTIPGERYGTLRRIRSRFHREVNGYFLCDRGRFGYDFVNSPHRLRSPLRHRVGELVPATKSEALAKVAEALRGGRVLGIGSPRASLEANFALRALVGPERFFAGVAPVQHTLLKRMVAILRDGPVGTATQQGVAQADALFILGEDLHNSAPMLALQVRQAGLRAPRDTVLPPLGIPPYDDSAAREAIQGARSPLWIATPGATKLDDLAQATYRAAPDDLARLGFAVAQALDPAAPRVSGLSVELIRLAGQIADSLRAAHRPVIIAGCSLGSLALVQAAANVAGALQTRYGVGALCFTMPACNSLGLTLLGGKSVDTAVSALRGGEVDTVIVLENDLFETLDGGTAEAIVGGTRELIVLDSLQTATTRRATLALPVATFAESTGTLVNHEGRAQRYFEVFPAADDIQASWRWLGEMAVAGGLPAPPWASLDALLTDLAAAVPVLAGVRDVAPPADFRLVAQKIPRQSHRSSGHTAITADRTVHEPSPPPDPDSPFAFSLEGTTSTPPAPLIPRIWAPGWNSEQALHKYQEEVGGPVRGGPSGRRLLDPPAGGTPRYFAEIPAAFAPRANSWLVIPVCHIFGAEEQSRLAPALAEFMPPPYLALHPDDARRAGIAEGEMVALSIDGQMWEAPARLIAALPPGVAAVPVGGAGLPRLATAAWGTVRPVKRRKEGRP
jgi:NADH-quinone oxidoreductase subunit G